MVSCGCASLFILLAIFDFLHAAEPGQLCQSFFASNCALCHSLPLSISAYISLSPSPFPSPSVSISELTLCLLSFCIISLILLFICAQYTIDPCVAPSLSSLHLPHLPPPALPCATCLCNQLLALCLCQ